jgi:site-specific DNA recombinase
MFTDIEKRRVDTVIVTELSRLSRSVKDFLMFIEFLERHEADFICPQLNFDTTTPAGRVFITILVALAQFERELTSERTKLNMAARAQRGLYNGGQPPLGYDSDPKQKGYLVVNKEEAALVRKIFEVYMSLGSSELTAQAINRAGETNKKRITSDGVGRGGRKFDDKSIRRVLQNVAYLGKRTVQDKDGNSTLNGAVWPAIIDEELFNIAQAKLEESRNVYKPEGYTNHPYILSGIARCGECGKTLTGAIGHGKSVDVPYYQHQGRTDCKVKRVQAKLLETEIFKRMKMATQNPDVARFLSEGASADVVNRMPVLETQMNSKEQEIRAARQKAENLLAVLADRPEGMEPKTILGKVQDYENQAKALEEEKEKLKLEIGDLKASILSDELVRAYLEGFFKNFEKQTFNERRDSLKYTLNYVNVHADELQLNYWAGAFASAQGRCGPRGHGFEYGVKWGVQPT